MSCLPFYLLLIVIGDTSSEAAAGPVLHSDTSSLPTVAYSSNQTTNSQVVSSILQTDISFQGQIYSSHQLVGHYQQISGMRELLLYFTYWRVYLFSSIYQLQEQPKLTESPVLPVVQGQSSVMPIYAVGHAVVSQSQISPLTIQKVSQIKVRCIFFLNKMSGQVNMRKNIVITHVVCIKKKKTPG